MLRKMAWSGRVCQQQNMEIQQTLSDGTIYCTFRDIIALQVVAGKKKLKGENFF